MTEGELVSVLLAERALQSYKGTPYAADLARVFRKITLGLPDQVTIDLGHLGGVHPCTRRRRAWPPRCSAS